MNELSDEIPPSQPADLPIGVADGERLFSEWAARMVAAGVFSVSTVETYSTIWHAWLSWLAARGLGWVDVNAATIQAYLEGPSPGLAHHRPALRADRMANYTQQRYWRVLRAVYAEAVRAGLLVSSPVLDVPEGDRPVIERSSRQSQVLPPGVLALLRDPDVIERCIPCLREAEWWVFRDRAAVLVLSHLGITTRELMALRGGDVVCQLPSLAGHVAEHVAIGRLAGSHPLPSPACSPAQWVPVSLAVTRDDEVVPRVLELGAAVREVLLSWLALRRVVLSARLKRRLVGMAVSDDQLDAVCLSEPLFMSRQRSAEQIDADRSGGAVLSVDKVGLLPPMEASNVYQMVKQALDALYGLPELAGQHPKLRGLNQASGAAIVRNSVLLDWVQTLGEEAAALLGGLRSVGSLRVVSLTEGPYPTLP